MFLKQSLSHNKVFLSLVQGYRDENGKTKHKTIQKLGYLEDLKNEYEDPIAYFKNIAKQKSNEEIREYTIKNLNTKLIDDIDAKKNLGYVILKNIYNELDIAFLLNEKNKNLKINYKLNDVFKLLVFSRILYPDSKLATYNSKDTFFDKFNFSEQDMYRSFNYFSSYKISIS